MAFSIIGHRGARALFAENTLEGFRAALELGFAAFETDVGMTRDGVPVILHDPCLSPDLTRDAAGNWLPAAGPPVAAMTLEATQSFNVGRTKPGSRAAKLFPNQRGFDHAVIPTLDAVLRLSQAARWTIEIKVSVNRPWLTAEPEVVTDAVVDVIECAGAASRVVIQSFDWRCVRHARLRRPDIARAWLTTRGTRAWRGGQRLAPELIAGEGGGTWSPHHRELTPRLLERAHRLGLPVIPWTVNVPDIAVRLVQWGVDGLITDDPAAIADAVQPYITA